MRGPKYRLSPNEVERLVKEERERRRKLRILQVREQAKASAASIRNDVRREKGKLLQNMALEIKEQLEEEKEEKLRQLQQKYENTLHIIGEGHKEAHIHGDIENRVERLQRQKEEELIVQARFKQALDLKKKLDSEKESVANRHINARKAALEVEKERSSHIASLPPPPPDISVQVEKMNRKKAILMMDMKAYATTHFHIPDYHVVKAGPEEQQMYDAKKSAEETDLKLKQDLQALKLSKHEQVERARIRGNEALQKEILKNDLGDMLKDLSLLQKKDRRRRQAVVSDIPKQVFVPPEKCLEERQERQKEMEAKFDELYLQHCKVDVEYLPSMSLSEYLTTTDSANSTALDAATPDISIPVSRINPALRDLTNVARQGEPAQMKKPETVLRQLLNRIKEQRDNTKTTDEARLAEETAALSGITVTPSQNGGKAVDTAKSESVSSKPGQLEAPVDIQQIYVTDLHKPEKEILIKGAELDVKALQVGEGEVLLSDPDKVAICSNNKMIEDLLKRIQTIEEQKQILSKQFQAHAGFYNRLVSEDVIDLDQSEYSSLKEVDIEQKDEQAKTPLTGMLGAEKLASGKVFYASEAFPGDKPGPDGMQRSSRTSEDYSYIRHLQSGQLTRTGAVQELGGDNTDLNKKFTAHENRVTFNHLPSYQYYDSPQERDALQKLSERDKSGLIMSHSGNSSFLTKGPNMSQKLLDYREKVKEKQAAMDEETTKRVREYQRKLFETHEERKKLLTEVRADIEKRRKELKLDAPGVLNEDANSSSTVHPSLYQVEGTSKIEHKIWEPIKPFIAEPRPGLLSSKPKDFHSAWLYDSRLERPDISQFGKEAKNVEMGVAEKRTDKIRRSLSFPDGDDSLSTTWNDTPASKCSLDLSNNSRIFSSEEDRGSPILSDKSKQSDNESFSATLVARAAESRRGFQQRQDEIQGQLIEIQRQKDAIQEKYSAGQQALQLQQLALKSKLAQAIATTREVTSRHVVVSRVAHENLHEPRLHRSWEGLSAPESDTSAVDISGMHFTSSRPDSSGGPLSDTTSGRHSLGTPGNLSADSYLADISYQKIKSTEFKNPPTAAFVQKDALQFSNIARPIPLLGSLQQPTWASLLKSSSDRYGQSNQSSLMQDFTQQTSWSGARQADSILPSKATFESYQAEQSGKFESIKDVMEGLSSQPSQTLLLPSPGLSQHQPHELSTILEVDTPMSLPGKGSLQKQAGSTANTMSSSLTSQTSDLRSIQTFHFDPDFKMDIFKESYALPTSRDLSDSGAVFQLSKPHNVLQAVEAVHSQGIMKEIGDQFLVGSKLGAKRTLNFSDSLDLPQKFDTYDFTEEEDLSSTRMPLLVESTPIRPVALHSLSALQSFSESDLANMTPTTNDTLRSIDITGYSEYLRTADANRSGGRSSTTPDQSAQEASIDQSDKGTRNYLMVQEDNQSGLETRREGGSKLPEEAPGCSSLVISEALLQTQEIDPMLVWRLQQQSREVFGDSLDNTGNPSGVSGSVSASMTAELEEVTISEQNTTDPDTSH